jgi:hypothetical protein
MLSVMVHVPAFQWALDHLAEIATPTKPGSGGLAIGDQAPFFGPGLRCFVPFSTFDTSIPLLTLVRTFLTCF